MHHLDDFFHRKYQEDATTGAMVQIATGEQLGRDEEANADAHIHLPSPSYWPIAIAIGVGTLGMGVVYGVPIMIVGVLIILGSSFGFVLEPSVADDIDYDPPMSGGQETKELAPLG